MKKRDKDDKVIWINITQTETTYTEVR